MDILLARPDDLQLFIYREKDNCYSTCPIMKDNYSRPHMPYYHYTFDTLVNKYNFIVVKIVSYNFLFSDSGRPRLYKVIANIDGVLLELDDEVINDINEFCPKYISNLIKV